MASADLPAPFSRPRRGRWLGGVCAGLAARWSLPLARVRAAFALGVLALGLGLLVYLAGWLILPAEGEEGERPGPRGIVLVAQVCGALVALATLGVAGAVATVFGFGWVVVAIGAAVLVGTLAGWPRVGPGWALLPIGALALPSIALAAGGLRIEPQTASVVVAPRTLAQLPRTLHSGLGLLEVDLRHTALPRTGTLAVRIDAGLRRTLVALPHRRCVHVEVRQRTLPLATRVAGVALGAGLRSGPGVKLFGESFYDTHQLPPPGWDRGKGHGPTLRLDFSSDGGSLVVRDYPAAVDPSTVPDWPGYPVDPEPRPDTSGTPRAAARRLIRRWRNRHREQVRDQRRIERLMRGPCARTASATAREGSKARRPDAHGRPAGQQRTGARQHDGARRTARAR